jgi:hypothetical protein
MATTPDPMIAAKSLMAVYILEHQHSLMSRLDQVEFVSQYKDMVNARDRAPERRIILPMLTSY